MLHAVYNLSHCMLVAVSHCNSSTDKMDSKRDVKHYSEDQFEFSADQTNNHQSSDKLRSSADTRFQADKTASLQHNEDQQHSTGDDEQIISCKLGGNSTTAYYFCK